MDYPIHNTDTMKIIDSFCISNGKKMSKVLYYDAFLSLKIVYILADSADPDEMPPYAAFSLGTHCLPQ